MLVVTISIVQIIITLGGKFIELVLSDRSSYFLQLIPGIKSMELSPWN